MKRPTGVTYSILLVSLALYSFGCGKDSPSGPTANSGVPLSADDAFLLYNTTEDIVVVDVSSSFTENHIPDAVNYALDDNTLRDVLPDLDTYKTFLLYSQPGEENAAASGAKMFINAGFVNIYRLAGSLDSWIGAGYETETHPFQIKHVDPHQAKILIEQDPRTVIIDVSRHWNEHHIPGSVQYYLGDGSLDNAIPELDPTRRYIIYCYLLSHSTESAQKLIDVGFPSVYHLDGGFWAWEQAGYEVIYPEN